MYAHKVIDDIKRNIGLAIKTKSILINPHFSIDRFIKHIEMSQKFHFGNSYDLDGIYKSHHAQRVFTENPDQLKFPFKICWFDYVLKKGDLNVQRGTLIETIDDNVFMITFFNDCNASRGWLVSDVIQKINIGTGDVERYFMFKQASGYSDIQDEHALAIDISLLERSVRLLNCKNITTEKIKPPEKLNKCRTRKGKLPIYDYHVLNVTVPGKKGETRLKTDPLYHNRVHLCRGHFKEYTEDKPLFGKCTGLYWWQPHVRGQNKDGIIVKDYNIKTEE